MGNAQGYQQADVQVDFLHRDNPAFQPLYPFDVLVHVHLEIGLLTALRVSHDSSDRNLSSTVETYPLNQSQISVFTEEVLKLAMSKGQITAWDLYNVATEIYKPGKTDFPALIPQNGAMAELLLSRLSEEVEVQYAVPSIERRRKVEFMLLFEE